MTNRILSMNQFEQLIGLTRDHMRDSLFVYKATSSTGDTCHFGIESAAKAWAKGGTVEAIKVREFKLHSSSPTAAPVGEREAFENEMRHVDVWGHRSLKKRASGNYENWQVNLMWDAWQARAALSAGDAVDAQRYRWLKGRSQVCLNQVWIGGYTTRQRDVDFLSKEDALSAIDTAIDAAMRKGQP